MPKKSFSLISRANKSHLSPAIANEKYFRLVSRREKCGLTARGGIFAIATLLSSSILIALTIRPFLAASAPQQTDILVVQGWISARGIPDRCPSDNTFNLLSESVHSRRIPLLFQKDVGPDIKVGIFALPPGNDSAARWWKYDAGVKNMIAKLHLISTSD